ncbi:hypothetical protein V2J09_020902 [Rumex salicifolius]
MATNRFLCEICGKGFQRDQNLQLHRRGHNLPWKLKQRSGKEPKKRVYVCPEKTCVHNHPSRALGDLTGIKKHFCRKHGEKKWKCDKCSKSYAVHSDCKAHSKTCGTREYKCDCGTIFSRRDSFITHRAFCDALAEETARVNAASHFSLAASNGSLDYSFMGGFMASQQQQQQQNFTLFKSLPTKQDNEATMINIDHHHHQKGSIPLWIMGQALPQQDQTTVSNDVIHQQLNNNSFYPCPQTLVSGLNPLQEQQLIQAPESNYQNLNWAFGNPAAKMCTNSTSSTSLLQQTISITNRDQELVGNVPCLYSNQLQTSSSSSHMSATALLQKAAQIGSTATDPFSIGGIKTNESKNSTNSIVNEVQDHRLQHQGMVGKLGIFLALELLNPSAILIQSMNGFEIGNVMVRGRVGR